MLSPRGRAGQQVCDGAAGAPHLTGPDQAAWLDRLDQELGNPRAAIATCQAQPDPDPSPGLRLAASLRVYWLVRGHAAEGADVLRTLLDSPVAQRATVPRARALAAAARLLGQTSGHAIAAEYGEEALAIARAVGDERLIADLLHDRAWVLLRQRQQDAALSLIGPGLDLARRLQERRLSAQLLSARSHALDLRGDRAGASRDAAESLRLFRQTGDQRAVGMLLGNLGAIELSADNLAAARRHLGESLDISRALNDRTGIAHATLNLGWAEYLGGSPGPARALFAESLDLTRRLRMKRHSAYALIGVAVTGYGRADPAWSARLHGAADQILADLGHALEPLEARLADLDRQRLRTAMGAEDFQADYAAGRALLIPGDLAEVLGALEPEDALAGPARTAAAAAEPGPALTPRELDVLKLVAQGLSNSVIARRLFLSEHTVHRHLANILRKLNLSSRAAAAAWGARTGLV